MYWAVFGDMDREQLLFHELGHCILNRPHDDMTTMFGFDTVPQSIMYSSHFPAAIYMEYHPYYILELFSQ